MNNTISINLIADSNVLELRAKVVTEEVYSEFAGDWLSLFHFDINEETGKVIVDGLQCKTKEFTTNLLKFVNKYAPIEPKVHQIRHFIESLEEDEHFIFIPNNSIEREDYHFIHQHLRALKSGKDFETVKAEFEGSFKNVFERFQIIHANGKRKYFFGVKNKHERVCRYCGLKVVDGATFKKTAHSICEALGNSCIFTLDECDTCNKEFGDGIEQDLVNYFDVLRPFFDIKGKEGILTIQGKNFKLTKKKDKGLYLTFYSERPNSSNNELNLQLDHNRKAAEQDIYKALCKCAIGVIPIEKLNHFKKTISWIRGNIQIDELPVVAKVLKNEMYVQHPEITVFLKQNGDDNLPEGFAVFRFTIFIYVFILPSHADKSDFIDKKNYEKFWQSMTHLNKIENWIFDNYSDKKKRNLSFKLNFATRHQN